MLTVFLSDHNFVSNKENLLFFFFWSNDLAEKIIIKKSEEEQGEKRKWKFATVYLRFFGTKILYHKKILADVENIVIIYSIPSNSWKL